MSGLKDFLKITALLLIIFMTTACMSVLRNFSSISYGGASWQAYREATESWAGAPIEELTAAWSPRYHGGKLSLLDYTGEDGKLHSTYNFRWAGEYFRMATTSYDPEQNGFVEVLPEERRSLLCEQEVYVVDGIISHVGIGGNDCGDLPPPPSRKKTDSASS